MTTMTRPVAPFAWRHHHPATTAALVVLFWMVAAVLVIAIRLELEPRSPNGAAAATVVALLSTAYAYWRFVAREAGAAHALGVGSAWLMLSIATEIAVTTRFGHEWFTLLGSPDRPLLRSALLFVWVFGPALFARRESAA